MQVIAHIPTLNNHYPDYLVQLSSREMSLLLGREVGGYYGNLPIKEKLQLQEEWSRMQTIWDTKRQLLEAASTLDTLSNNIKQFSPVIEAITQGKEQT